MAQANGWGGELPMFLQLRETLAERIHAGEFATGQPLPSERELAADSGLARMTVREALRMLEGEGLIYRVERRGYFVSPPRLRYDPNHHINVMRLIPAQGHSAENIDLGRLRVTATPTLQRLFACVSDASLILERSVVRMNGRKLCYEEDYLLESAVPGYFETETESPLTQYLERRYGVRTEMTGFRARPTSLYGMAAKNLDVRAGTPGLYITRIKKMNERVLEVDREYWLSDALEIVVGDFPG